MIVTLLFHNADVQALIFKAGEHPRIANAFYVLLHSHSLSR